MIRFPSSNILPNLESPVVRSLSIQFILQALIDIFALMENLQLTKLSKDLASITDKLEEFLFFLDKLSFYGDALKKTSQVQETESIFLIEEMRKEAFLLQSKMVIWKKMPTRYSLSEMEEQLMRSYFSSLESLKRLFEALSPFLKEARSDENVLVYLIENKEKFNKHLGSKWIEGMLQSFFPAGHDQLRAVIIEGYTRRGFSQFLSKLEPLIDEIQWEAPCQS